MFELWFKLSGNFSSFVLETGSENVTIVPSSDDIRSTSLSIAASLQMMLSTLSFIKKLNCDSPAVLIEYFSIRGWQIGHPENESHDEFLSMAIRHKRFDFSSN
ncbi:MAG TPA: hypothetical protein VNR87_18250 [Flavisolibacter sp.]|nr:hypothetical protein [Flavisolibacter sp.]